MLFMWDSSDAILFKIQMKALAISFPALADIASVHIVQ